MLYLPTRIMLQLKSLENTTPDAEYFYDLEAIAKERHTKTGNKGLATRMFESGIITPSTRDQCNEELMGHLILVSEFGVTSERADVSNLIKSLEDGMKGVAFKDDRQIAGIIAMRTLKDKPSIDVQLYRI